MEGEVIKSFLVGLGFGVDEASLAKFNKGIASATLRVSALYGSIQAAAASIGYGITKISEDFEKMGYEYHIIAPAINKALLLRRELLKAYSAAGINISKVVRESLKLNLSLTKTKFAFEAIYKSVGSRFFELLTKQSDLFRQRIYANMPKILNILESVVKFIFKAFEATTTLGLRLWSVLSRVFDFFVALDKATDHWSTIVLGLIAAWKLLNLSFLTTPLGIILSLGAALLTLYDDYKTFQEGGQSFINWAKFVPAIEEFKKAISSVSDVLQGMVDIVTDLILSLSQLFQKDYSGAWDSLRKAGESLINTFKGIWGFLGSINQATDNLASGFGFRAPPNFANAAANISGGGPGGIPYANPVSGNVSHSSAQTNQNVNQQTNINITGVPDANAAGQKVLGEQGKVNFNLARNLKGNVRAGGQIK